jgi:hypothetical protein
MAKAKGDKMVVKAPGEQPKIVEVAYKIPLETMQKTVGGYIQWLPLTSKYDLFLNEEGKLMDLEPNFPIYGGRDIIVGAVLVCRHNNQGVSLALTDEEAREVVEMLNNKIPNNLL